ncbi:hypothetical protein KO481_17030 [Nocardia sp. NEAU-G5]|uniref:Uncharacterized protein n=1 Tax=Nocardia albiluteola TaxID=2842303 RepID=A0ABS6B0F6_9NOCA|nr:hypothetical protein [Nocardia albiluteola]MBU3063226.1 hypothetical protein [Nocardia albiluteola]
MDRVRPCADVELDDMWARPRYLGARADAWAECLAPALSAEQTADLERALADLPALFDGRPAVLAHGDYVLAAAWPSFLAGMGIDPAEPLLAQRIRLLQVVRTLEMLADDDLAPGNWRVVHERLVSLLAET